MKKILALLLVLCTLPALFACGTTPAADQTAPSTEATIPPAIQELNGKKIIFIGNSHTYVGNVVSQVYNKYPQQEKRNNNKGTFYLLCKQMGCEVSVTNWTFSSHGLRSIFGGTCTTKGDCKDLNHEEYLTDRFFDYVVIQPGVGENSESQIAEDIAYITDFFRKENPDVKFILLGNTSVYGNNSNGKTYPGITSYYKTLDEQGFLIADWGKLVNDLIHGEVTPEGSTIGYNKSTFIIKDGFHPNYLSGYIASTMVLSLITGIPAAQIPATMYTDDVMTIALDSHLEKSYERPDYDTNCRAVLTTEVELQRIHLLIDQYLAEKPYLSY